MKSVRVPVRLWTMLGFEKRLLFSGVSFSHRGASSPSDFCQIWPARKAALERGPAVDGLFRVIGKESLDRAS